MPSFFTDNLLDWHRMNPRPLPWSADEMNPYRIWLSEIIMQQTRIQQGSSYYSKFTKYYPSVQDLAAAPLSEIMKHWEGLGYYTRARNLHRTAKFISAEMNGVFPETYAGLLSLPGIGPYSAAAIASFAYNHSHAVVDGNVKRLVARFAGIAEPVDEKTGYEKIFQFATKSIVGVSPADFNQAIMNFGALICKPKPLCEMCPLAPKCYALQHSITELLPVKAKKLSRSLRFFHFIIITHKSKMVMMRRGEKDIWRDLCTPPMIETSSARSPGEKKIRQFVSEIAGDAELMIHNAKASLQQELSHQSIVGRFHFAELSGRVRLDKFFLWVDKKSIDSMALPRMIVEARKKKIIPL
ncbi:MAG: A/G-specific adenine glycosylase [Bacteroidota bacterium]|nr:A/G-specific adenine glycosylase [Bacteroidota bacterium]